MDNVAVWSIVTLVLIALVFYLVTVESDAEMDPLRQEGGLRGLWKSFNNGLHRNPAPEPIDTDLTGFLASGTEAGPAYVEADRVAARITHHTKTGFEIVRGTVDPLVTATVAPKAPVQIGDNPLALYPPPLFLDNGAGNRRQPVVEDFPSEPVRSLDEPEKPPVKAHKFAITKRLAHEKPEISDTSAAAPSQPASLRTPPRPWQPPSLRSMTKPPQLWPAR